MASALRLTAAVFLSACGLLSQDNQPAADPAGVSPRKDSVVVTGTYEPLPLEEADRKVRVLDLKPLEPLTNTYADLLRLDSSLDLRQRGSNGLQGDLSIRGGGFGQTLVLLDGLRLNDVQSGHHNLDVPAPLEALGRVEVLKGSGSTMYGSDAVGGVVNFITRQPESSEVRLRTAIGNFGVNQQRGTIAFAGSRATEQISFSRDFSTGFIPDRDYRNLSLSSATHLTSPVGNTDLRLAYRDSPFGAGQFYGDYNSWERTKTWWGTVRQTLGQNTEASLAYRRHTDLFVLYRDRPQVFTNRHVAESYQAALRRRDKVGRNSNIFCGFEAYDDSIDSNNLGLHHRTRGAGYVALDVRALRRFSFTAGLRDEVYGSANHEFSPSVSAGAWLSRAVKLRAGVSRAFRLPTYTDLYYHDPANRGSADLRPERAWSFEGGIDWNPTGHVRAEATVFHRRETDGIDYVRFSPADIWRATNFQHLRFTGIEAGIRTRLRPGQEIEVQYTGLRGAQNILAGALSKYVFNYPVHSGIVTWQGNLLPGFVARSRVGVLHRFTRDPYAVWDLYGARNRGTVRPFLQLANMSNTRYQEIPGVAMPGRAVVGGLELVLFGPR